MYSEKAIFFSYWCLRKHYQVQPHRKKIFIQPNLSIGTSWYLHQVFFFLINFLNSFPEKHVKKHPKLVWKTIKFTVLRIFVEIDYCGFYVQNEESRIIINIVNCRRISKCFRIINYANTKKRDEQSLSIIFRLFIKLSG